MISNCVRRVVLRKGLGWFVSEQVWDGLSMNRFGMVCQ